MQLEAFSFRFYPIIRFDVPGDTAEHSEQLFRKKAQMKNVASKFNGHVYRIETRHQPKPTKPPQFTLVGCESEFGLPYWFIEEDLILL